MWPPSGPVLFLEQQECPTLFWEGQGVRRGRGSRFPWQLSRLILFQPALFCSPSNFGTVSLIAMLTAHCAVLW